MDHFPGSDRCGQSKKMKLDTVINRSKKHIGDERMMLAKAMHLVRRMSDVNGLSRSISKV